MWVPFGAVLAAYGPFYYRGERRIAFAAVAVLAAIAARVCKLSEAASALRHVADGKAIGKVIVRVG